MAKTLYIFMFCIFNNFPEQLVIKHKTRVFPDQGSIVCQGSAQAKAPHINKSTEAGNEGVNIINLIIEFISFLSFRCCF